MDITILGNNSALPAHNRFPSCQIVRCGQQLFMVDCGEGSQIKFTQYKIKRARIGHIFISHLHGDHYFGLPGVITSYNHYDRSEPLHIYGPSALEEIIRLILRHGDTELKYELVFHPLGQRYVCLLKTSDAEVWTFPMHHRIETHGFLFVEKTAGYNIKEGVIEKYALTIDQIKTLKASQNILLPNGQTRLNAEATSGPQPEKRYAYCSDTIYDLGLIRHIQSVDLLYHEATFMNHHADKATLTKHSTAAQAADLARQAQVRRLLLGHFSSRYELLDELLAEATAIFPPTELSQEGRTYTV